jgi:hypothetical protein
MEEGLILTPELQAAVVEELKKGYLLEQVKAAHDSSVIGRLNRHNHRSLDGVGELKARIDPTSYHFWGQKLGYKCWQDKTFLKEYLRDNEYARVNCGGTKLQIGYYPSTRKKVKSYA